MTTVDCAKVLTAAAMLFAAACATAPSAGTAPAKKAGPVAPPPPAFEPEDVLGASSDQVNALFGAPALTRREGEGEYRRYRLSTCSLIVILYPDDLGRRSVAHAEATALNSDQEKPDLKSCLAAG